MKEMIGKVGTLWMVILFPFLNWGNIHAQSPTDQPSLMNITPPSPNAAALGKFGDVQIGPSTGIPQIDVPIYSYSNIDNTLKLDISLDYHAGGVRVDEVASNAGSGWSLSAGGAITRTVRDIYDEAVPYGFMNYMAIPSEMEGNKRGGGGTITSMFNYIATKNADGQNDIFSFNFSGRSGQFMYGKNNDFLMQTSNKLKVEKKHGALLNGVASDMISVFTVTDENGVKYIFDALEFSDDGTMGAYHKWVSAWYLTKIISASNRDSIVLEYEDEHTKYTAGRFVTMTYGVGGTYTKAHETSYSTVITDGVRVKKILFPDGVNISFSYDKTARLDMQSSEGLVRLQQISITDNTYTRGYNLYHDYSTNRLTLKKVVPYNVSGEDKGYSFDYNGVLPARLDNNQDHWGFYNTNPGNDMLPTYKNQRTGEILQGGKRDTDSSRSVIGSLKRFSYPTGGYTDFEMEANTSEDPRLSDTSVTYIKDKNFDLSLYCSSSAPATEPFTFNGDQGTTTQFNVNIYQSPGCTGAATNCNFIVQVKNSSNQVLTTQTIKNDGSYQYKDYSFTLSNLAKGNYSWYVYTTGMNYNNYMTVSWKEVHNLNPDTIKSVIKNLYVGGLRVKSIKTYDAINAMPASVRLFEYTQENSTKSSGSLGVLPVYEYPVGLEYTPRANESGTDPYVIYTSYGIQNAVVRASSSLHTLASINGSPITYSRVVERQINRGQTNGHIDRYFTSYTPGGLVGYNVFPFISPSYFSWSYGQLEKELVYDNKEVLIKKTENEYQTFIDNYYSNTQRLINFTCVSLVPVDYLVLSEYFSWEFVSQVYYYASRTFAPNGGRKDLKKSIVTEYANGQAFVSQTDYTYDTAFNVKTTSLTNSLGEKIEKVVTYPYEYTNSVAQAMMAQNMYGKEIAIENWKTKGTSKYLTGGYINKYVQHSSGIRSAGIAALMSTVAVPIASVGTFNAASFNKDANLFKDLVSFSQYTAKGYLNEQSKISDTKHAYIYGYNGNKVIAETINASVSEIAYSGFDEDGKGNWTFIGLPVADASALSGNNVYNLSTGAISKLGLTATNRYKVTYWSKSGAASINGTSGVQKANRNGWLYYEHVLPVNTTSVSVSGTVIIDDLRLYPVDATMSSYTYQPLFGVTAICNPKNEFLYYQYDGFGRLKVIKDADGKVLKEYDYQYQAPITK
jgi:YD repeat-containing protein